MTETNSLARVFIGSSIEGREVARHLQVELGNKCQVVRWDQEVFDPSGYALDSLVATAAKMDFAVLIATPDDTIASRGVTTPTARDNVVLEFGLFVGAIGRARTFLLATGVLTLPSDVFGLTRLTYQRSPDGNERAAVTSAALEVEQQIQKQGLRTHTVASQDSDSVRSALDKELAILLTNATAQGWSVRTDSTTTLRLRTPRGKTMTLTKGPTEATRHQLREFVAELRAAGLRVNSSIRRPVEESPF
ncbi:hypothetical protein GCM10022239_10850 [Leifsonia bigeumensis]|uniref:CD-NTase-associated protein 12/Pycsar effector protein TIR domain-containing protein n=1 Tax=Leifsonella bigeumensis TaxID=433643 RepID=A0ABP7FE56_9MICO